MLYFSDDFNFRRENFPSLYMYLDKNNIHFEYDHDNTELKKFSIDVPTTRSYENLSVYELETEKYKDTQLYNVYEQQLFYHCSSLEEWKYLDIPRAQEERFCYILNRYYEIVIKCRETAIFWIDYWTNKINTLKVDAGMSFGGSLIYANAFAKVLLVKGIPHYCVEHFFTGNEWYLEKRYEPLPNNSIIQSTLYCSKLDTANSREKSIVKLSKANNKNVKQPAYLNLKNENYCLILGQVCNDFSLASKNNTYKNSARFYLQLIENILNKTPLNIVLKTHPYEQEKLMSNTLTTYQYIKKELQKIPNAKNRVTLLENFSLEGLLDGAKFIVTLNSQAGLQALQRFKPVVCFGGAFYGKKGFTYDYETIDEFLAHIEEFYFDMEIYEKYMQFMDAIFEHLISINEEDKVYRLLHNVLKNCSQKEKSSSAISENLKKSLISPVKKIKQLPPWQRKIRKLLRSPRQFFADARIFKNL